MSVILSAGYSFISLLLSSDQEQGQQTWTTTRRPSMAVAAPRRTGRRVVRSGSGEEVQQYLWGSPPQQYTLALSSPAGQ